MVRIAKGADRIAGRDALPSKISKLGELDISVPPPLPPPPKEAYYVFALEGPVGRLICPERCKLIRIAAWMWSANNIKFSIFQGFEDDEPTFSRLIPVIRGKQTINTESLDLPGLERLDMLTFEVTKPTSFLLSAVFREL